MERSEVGMVSAGGKEFVIRTPSAAEMLRIAKFISQKLLKAQRMLEVEWAMTDVQAPFLVMSVLAELDDSDLDEVAVMLLQKDTQETREIVRKHLDLVWLSELVKLWVQGARIGEVIRNFTEAFTALVEAVPVDAVVKIEEAKTKAQS